MAEKKKTINWWWPKITDQATAIEASKAGYWAAVMVASITAIFATIALVTQKELATLDASAYFDAVLFFIIAWRIKNYSKLFAIAGILLFILEKIMLAQTQGAKGWPLAIVLLLMFISGVRGVFAYHKYSTSNKPQTENI
jgi:hypothetical protein